MLNFSTYINIQKHPNRLGAEILRLLGYVQSAGNDGASACAGARTGNWASETEVDDFLVRLELGLAKVLVDDGGLLARPDLTVTMGDLGVGSGSSSISLE